MDFNFQIMNALKYAELCILGCDLFLRSHNDVNDVIYVDQQKALQKAL